MNTMIIAAATIGSFASLAAYANPAASDPPRSHAECASLFMTLDKDADGRISRSEASADPVIAEAFDGLQLGESGFMNVDEFMSACEGGRAHVHRKQ